MVPKKIGGAGQQTRHEKGGIHDNPASGHHQRHRHTEPNQWNTYQTRYLPKGGWRGKKGLKISEQNDLSHRPASKCNANHEAPPAESSKRSPLSCSVGRPLTGIVLNLTLPKLHLATLKHSLFTIYKIFPKHLAGMYMEHNSLGCPSGKFPGQT